MKESEVRNILISQLGSFEFKTDKLTQRVNEYDVDLTGFIKWLIETKGIRHLKQNILSEQNMKRYKQTLSFEKKVLPQLILNAGELYKKLANSSILQDSVIEKLESMTQPHILYFLFISVGQNVDNYRAAARRYSQVFPQAVLSLPEPYCTLGKAFIS